MITNAGGSGILCADACDGSRPTLPALSEEMRNGAGPRSRREASLANLALTSSARR